MYKAQWSWNSQALLTLRSRLHASLMSVGKRFQEKSISFSFVKLISNP